ncbi:M20/M25/M40 family metallo-hydrolase [Pseudobacillus badius]|uniref:M20/M25/M40 family metallo-hydrolase n=1 Tax=Bacillus badius TaxID=1455 RepID=UPI0007B3A430|nr:M20/M25/M40 family metallo-hydrolase [Bacillus badius]KZR57523.1 hypothetical protein A3781_19720 [Bacillus badius]
MKQMKKQLVQLLNIQAPSGQEHRVVHYVKPILEKMTDAVWLDPYGNLLAEKKVGSGQGATIILSAHMDSVNRLDKDRKVIEKGGVFTSTKGVLGADDRAGMAIILAVLRNVEKTGFDGTIKVAFSREEEIGCIGSSRIDKEWIKGADLALVVDRRGNNDIVVGNFSQAFCSTAVGNFLEDCSAMLDMDWKACEGGISDACTFAELGVNSVNLSAGYRNEHTDEEYVVFDDMKKTVNLMLQALALVNDFAGNFGEVPDEGNEWIDLTYRGYGYSGWENDDMYIDLWEGRDTFGTVTSSITDGNIQITQKCGNHVDEIYITKETFEKIIQTYYVETTVDRLPFEDGRVDELDELEKKFIEQHGNTSGIKL